MEVTLESLPRLHGSFDPATRDPVSAPPPLPRPPLPTGVVNAPPREMSTDPCRFVRTRTRLASRDDDDDDEEGNGIMEGGVSSTRLSSTLFISVPRVMAMLPVLDT